MRNRIKAGIGIIMLMLVAGHAMGQNREIRFETGGFQEALTKARQEQKMVFMDCYTSWCGPCKLLAKNVFTQDSVADFFNTHFVNFSIDMEKGEGKELQAKYQIEAYPTLLLIGEDGSEVFRSVGGCSAEQLMSRFRAAMNPENTLPGMEKKFAAGERDPQFVEQYWKMLSGGQQIEKLQQSTAAYFDGMRVADICREANWRLYDRYVDIDNPLYHLMIEQLGEFEKLKGRKLIEDKLYDAYDLALMGRIPNVGHTKEQVEQFTKDIEKIGFQDQEQLFYLQAYLKISRMKVEKQYGEFLDFMETGLENFSREQRTRAMFSLIMLADATPELRSRGNRVLVREAQAIMKDNNGVLPPYENQMFGFLQFRLMGENTDQKPE